VLARRCLRRGKRDDGGALDDLLQQRRRHCATRPVQQAAGHDDGVDIGFHRQRAPERLGDDHDLDGSAADPADVLRQRGAQNAEFVGETTPDVGLPARPGLGRGPALLEVVSGR
jgi:hypothetical protein